MKFLENLWRMWERKKDIKFVTTEARRNYLVSGPYYHTLKTFFENLLAIEMKNKTKIFLKKKTVYLGISILVK